MAYYIRSFTVHYILGITCIQDRSNGKIGLKQELCIDKLIDRYGLNDSKVVSTPSDPNMILMKNDGISNSCDKSLTYIILALKVALNSALISASCFTALMETTFAPKPEVALRVYCVGVRSAILATAWLLVRYASNS